jgi:hypothetical protein
MMVFAANIVFSHGGQWCVSPGWSGNVKVVGNGLGVSEDGERLACGNFFKKRLGVLPRKPREATCEIYLRSQRSSINQDPIAFPVLGHWSPEARWSKCIIINHSTFHLLLLFSVCFLKLTQIVSGLLFCFCLGVCVSLGFDSEMKTCCPTSSVRQVVQ